MPDFVTSDGLRLHFEDSGSGEPLLCLAGLTRNSRDFDPLRENLPGVRIVTMDYRGRGLSEYDANYLNYSVPREGLDAVELLDHLGLDAVTVLGTSRGGLIAMGLAATVPARLSGVILNDVGPEVGPAGIARIMQYLGMPPVAHSLDQMAQLLKAGQEDPFPGVPLAVWRRQAAAQFRETGQGLELLYDAHLRTAILEQASSQETPDLWPFFEALKALPTAVLRGANSDILLPETVQEMQRRHPGLLVTNVPDRGHVPFLDEAECLDTIRTILGEAR